MQSGETASSIALRIHTSARILPTAPDVLRRIVDWASDKHLPRPARGIVTYFRFLMRGNHTFEKIESIEEIGKEPTFNLVLPRTHSFLSNGMISHYSVTDR